MTEAKNVLMTRGAEQFQELRNRHGLTLRDAAKQLGVSHVAVWNWEEGTRRPKGHIMERIEMWSGGLVKAEWWMMDSERANVVPLPAKRRRRAPQRGAA